MRIFNRKAFRESWAQFPDAEQSLKSWYKEIEQGEFKTPSELAQKYNNMDVVKGQTIFNIRGDSYRLVVEINYEFQAVYFKFFNTHKEYDKLDFDEL